MQVCVKQQLIDRSQVFHQKFEIKLISYLIKIVIIRQWLLLVLARLIWALDSFQHQKKEHLSSIELSMASAAHCGKGWGLLLILIKRARLIVFSNPVCHGRCAVKYLWHNLTYGQACCSIIHSPQNILFTVGLVPKAIFSSGLDLCTNRIPNLQA